jgi:hypothetical protein
LVQGPVRAVLVEGGLVFGEDLAQVVHVHDSVAAQLPGRPVEWEVISGGRLTQSGISTADIDRVRRSHTGTVGTRQLSDRDECTVVGFPLEVSGLLITPKETKTRPWLGDGERDS